MVFRDGYLWSIYFNLKENKFRVFIVLIYVSSKEYFYLNCYIFY